MTGLMLATAALVPVYRDHSLGAEQVTQLVMGERVHADRTSGEWYAVRTALEGYAGWVHRGYVRPLAAEEAGAWDEAAWSDGATVASGPAIVPLPVRARVLLSAAGAVTLADRRTAVVRDGVVRPLAEARRGASSIPAHRWAREVFAGAPYLWGGVTPWGVDCSGLVQTTFLARGVTLPRDAADQAAAGAPVDAGDRRPDDLLFFRGEDSERITHVAIAVDRDTIVHATVACGGVVVESTATGSRAAPLWARLAAVRRLLPPECP